MVFHIVRQNVPRSLQTSCRWTCSLVGDDYQFLHKSIIPTYHFQKSLRRLPIPKLDDSCQRLLVSAKSVLPDFRYKVLERDVEYFRKMDGPELQKHLLIHDKHNKHTSFISEPWFDLYLADRKPVAVNSNPFMMFANDPDEKYNEQLSRATNLVVSIGRFKRSLDANLLEPEVFHLNPKKSNTDFFRKFCKTLPPSVSWFGAAALKAFPLDMSQYRNLFGGTRIPQKGKDKIYHCEGSKHFVVLHSGKLYSVDLFDEDGALASPEQIHACLSAILYELSPTVNRDSVGSLTTMNRDRWAEARIQLSSIAENAVSLVTIDSALFVLCLDALDTENPSRLNKSLLEGDDASNRWFDKCFQLIVDSGGRATINFEHSWGDGVAVLRLMEEIYKDTCKHHFVSPEQPVDKRVNVLLHYRPLRFHLNESLKRLVTKAKDEHARRGLCYGAVEYRELSREKIKSAKLSPDSIMQLAFQLAFYRCYKEFVPTYESCSTAAFLKGRTECMRPATDATRNAVRAIESDHENLIDYLKECSKVHAKLVKEASLGAGFDRHLMGLRITAERLGRSVPTLFKSEEFNYMNHFVLSTSTLSTETIGFGGFGPVVRNGFGIGYNVTPARMGAVVSAYEDNRNAKEFAEKILESLEVLNHIIQNA